MSTSHSLTRKFKSSQWNSPQPMDYMKRKRIGNHESHRYILQYLDTNKKQQEGNFEGRDLDTVDDDIQMQFREWWPAHLVNTPSPPYHSKSGGVSQAYTTSLCCWWALPFSSTLSVILSFTPQSSESSSLLVASSPRPPPCSNAVLDFSKLRITCRGKCQVEHP